MPKVAVLVTACNAERTVVAAVDSVLASSIDCQVYVVDNCSRQPVELCLRQVLDRVTIIRLEKNVSLAQAHNVALEEIVRSGFDYVAIMDARDISTPTRLEKQVAFLENNPKTGAVGSWLREFHHSTRATIRILSRPSDPRAVRNLMFFNNALPHAAAMFRVEAFRRVGLYSLEYPAADDYELLRRIGLQYELSNIQEHLVHYRSLNEFSPLMRAQQLRQRFRIQLKYFDVLKWQAYAGLLQTAVTMFTPRDLFKFVKMGIGAPTQVTRFAKFIGL